jgi:hypothetical protein
MLVTSGTDLVKCKIEVFFTGVAEYPSRLECDSMLLGR